MCNRGFLCTSNCRVVALEVDLLLYVGEDSAFPGLGVPEHVLDVDDLLGMLLKPVVDCFSVASQTNLCLVDAHLVLPHAQLYCVLQNTGQSIKASGVLGHDRQLVKLLELFHYEWVNLANVFDCVYVSMLPLEIT